jgi:protein-L-isoaspartate(D-aspartate) O-methyltransferase
MVDLAGARARMVELDLAPRGITDPRVLDAFRGVAREAFLPDDLAPRAYEDNPLPIGEGQTISQPYIVALTVQALGLNGREKVLEVGTGSGYAAAILGKLAQVVYTVERLGSLAATAKEHLISAGSDNVHVECRDGSLGWPEHAPFDAIAVGASGPVVPSALLSQLTIGGRLVMPVGDDGSQTLVRVTRERDGEFREEHLSEVRFVPLIGAQAWAAKPRRFSSS